MKNIPNSIQDSMATISINSLIQNHCTRCLRWQSSNIKK